MLEAMLGPSIMLKMLGEFCAKKKKKIGANILFSSFK